MDRLIEQKRGPQLWYLLNLALWWKQYIAQQPSTFNSPAADPVAAMASAHTALVSA